MASNDKHYHPAIAARLRTLIAAREWDDVPPYLSALSNAHFRTAGYILGEMLMPEMPESDFFALSRVLIDYNSKAFLMTMTKCVIERGISVQNEAFCALFKSIKDNEIEVQKVLQKLLPEMNTPTDIVCLLDIFEISAAETRVLYLLRVNTISAMYVLFLSLKYVENDRSLLIRTTYFLIKRGDGLSYNMASLLKSYFGLEEVKGTFSLRIEPYQLARLESSYEAFCKALKM